MPGHRTQSGPTALDRLRQDKAMRPILDRRADLSILAERLERAARGAMTQHLAARVRTDRRFAPVLGSLIRMTLEA